jgi:hypothetical protein
VVGFENNQVAMINEWMIVKDPIDRKANAKDQLQANSGSSYK